MARKVHVIFTAFLYALSSGGPLRDHCSLPLSTLLSVSTSPLYLSALYSLSLPRPVRPGTAAHTTSHNTLIHRYSPLSSLLSIYYTYATPLHSTIL